MAKSKDLNHASTQEQLRAQPQATQPTEAVAAKAQAGQAALLRAQAALPTAPQPTQAKAKRGANKLLGLPGEEELGELNADGAYTPVAESQGVQVAQAGPGLPESVTSAASDAAGSAASAGTTAATSTAAGAATGAATGGAALGGSTLAMLGGGLAVAAGLGGGGSKAAAPQTAITVLDGRIKNASVYIDTNNNGALDDADTKIGTTDAQGVLKVDAAAVAGKTLLTQGGVDISTGLEFTGVMKALAGASIVSPLTTLVHAVATSLSSNPTAAQIAEAEATVKVALGLSGVTESLQSYNPLAVLEASGSSTTAQSAAQSVMKAAIQVANLISVAASAVKAEDAESTATAAQATYAQLATAIADANGSYDLSSAANISTVLSAAGLGANVDAIAATIAASNIQIAASADLTEAVQVQTVAQGTVAKLVEQGNYAALSDYDSAAEIGSVAENVVNSSSLSISSDKTILKLGDVATLTFKFSKAPTGFELADIVVEADQGTVSNLSAAKTNSTTGEVTYTATFTPSANIKDSAVNISVAGTAYTFSGSTPQDAKTALPVDTQVPSAPTLALGAGFTGGATSAEATAAGAITVEAEAGASVAVTFSNGNNTVSKTVTGNGTTPVAVTLTSADLTTLGYGTISISATATDGAGNTSSAGTSSFVLDTTAPEAPTLALGTGVTGGATSAEATAAGGAVTVVAETGASVAVTFTNGNKTVSKTVTGNGSTPVAVALTSTDLTTLGNGTISVSATQTDVAGNLGSAATTSFVLDTVAPTAPTIALGAGVSNGATSAEATAAGGAVTVVAESNASTVVTFTNGSKTVSKTVTGNGSTAVPVTLTSTDLSTLGDGTISVSAIATDAAGNASNAATTNFVLDTVAPTAPTLALGTGVTGGATSAEATAAGGAVTVVAESNASTLVTFTNGSKTVSKTVTGNGATSVPVTLTSTDLTTLGDGTISVSAVATDGAGNASSAGTNSFTLDTVAPTTTAAVTGISDNVGSVNGTVVSGKTTDDTNLEINGTISAALISGESVNIYDGSNLLGTATVSGTTWTFADTRTLTDAQAVSYTARVTDLAGNQSNAGTVYTATVDTSIATPVLALGTGVENGANNLEARATTGVVTVAVETSASTVVTFTNGSNVVTKTVTGNGSTPVAVVLTGNDLATLGNGTISVSAVATDLAGNTSTAGTTSFTLNTTVYMADLVASSTGFVINGESAGDTSGYAVSYAGDVNGDKLADLIIGAKGVDVGVNGDAGRSYVVFGKTGAATAINLSAVAAGSGGFAINGQAASDNSGYSVSSAGDVNGDGLMDVIVGAKDAASGAGRSYVVFGKTTGTVIDLSAVAAGTGGFAINGEVAADASGISVASAGDMNGDGLADLVIGASNADAGANADAGRSYVVFGKTSGTAVELTALAAGTPTGGFVINGANASDSSGWSVSSVGDVNGDGLADLIIGAKGADVGGNVDAGRSYMVFGKTSLTAIELSAVAAETGGFVINGQAASDNSGWSVSAAGDVNGDGLSDVILGAKDAASGAGRSYVVFGKTGTTALDLSAVSGGTGGFVINGNSAGDNSGWSVSAAGDVDGDGLGDLLIGAPGAGSSYLVLGKTSGAAVNLSTLQNGFGGGFVIGGLSAGDGSGVSVSALGDFNGDGYADLLVGADQSDPAGGLNAGQSYVIYGGTQYSRTLGTGYATATRYLGTSAADAVTLTATDVANLASTSMITGVAGGAGFDVIKLSGGASMDLTAISNAGGMATSSGEASSRLSSIERIDLATDAASNILSLSATDVNDMAGMNLIRIGSVSADGKTWTNQTGTPLSTTTPYHQLVVDGNSKSGGATEDLLVLQPGPGAWVRAGRVHDGSNTYVVYQNDTTRSQVIAKESLAVIDNSLAPAVNLSAVAAGTGGFVINGEAAGDSSGYAVSSLGDVNGDGLMDVVIGAKDAATGAGRSYVVFGKTGSAAIDLSAVAAGTGGFAINGAAASDLSGWSVSSAGDVNGDGLADVLVGAGGSDESAADAGRTYVVYGKTGTGAVDLSAVAAGTGGFAINGAAAGDGSGWSVSSAGDVNGDGYMDLIIGAKDAASGAGRSYVVFGKAAGTNIELSAMGTGGFAIHAQTAGGGQGWSVSSAGDVNGDGLADVIVGAKDVASGAGRSYVVFGKTGSTDVELSAVAAGTGGFAINGAAASDYSGWSVSAAGDVNGDGLADVVIGAKAADVGGLADAGRSYVVFGKTSGAAINLTAVAAGTGGYVINGVAAGDQSGVAVSSAGDINGDGLADLIVSAASAGKSWVVYGATGGTAINLSAVETGVGGFVVNGQSSDGSNFAVSAAGDMNGDGYADLLVGASNGGTGTGHTYVIFGSEKYIPGGLAYSTGSEVNNFVIGTTGADTIKTGNTGASNNRHTDVMSAASGNDVIILGFEDTTRLTQAASSATAARVVGGAGFDTLRLAEGTSLNMTAIMNASGMSGEAGETTSRISGIERIDLVTDTAANTLTLAAVDVNDMAGMNLIRIGSVSADGKTWTNVSGTALAATTPFHQLVVDGTASDVVDLKGAAAAWTNVGVANDGTSDYTVYQSTATNSQVLVKSGVTVTGSLAPVVLDLNGDGVLQYGQTRMDVNGDGVTDLMAWAGAQDGVLVHDTNGDGQVNGAAEFAFARHEGETDLQGLAAQFDSNGDGVLDMLDAQFAEFAVWQDANGNGVSDAGELHSLSALGITAIGLVSDGVQRTPAAGVTEAGRTSAQLLNGTQMLVSDASFTFAAAPAQADSATAVMALFDGAGSGAADAAAQFGPVVGVNAHAQADLLLQQALLLQTH